MKKLLFLMSLLFVAVLIGCKGDDDEEVTPTEIEITTEDFTATFQENPSNGQVLGTVTASSSQGEVAFSITSQSPAGAMAIDVATGELSVADSALFDFELNTSLTATIEVTAEGAAPKEVTATISLTDNPEKRPFVTTWETTTADESITIYVNPDVTGYDYHINWGDGSQENNLTGDASHQYSTAGTYTVRISGSFPAIYSDPNNRLNAEKLQSIESWGTSEWKSMKYAFLYCSSMIYNATDTPDFSQVSSMSKMFANCESFNGNIGDWNVSNVTDMTYMFQSARSFNQDLNNWNVSNVERMFHMFEGASVFNGNITDWNTSNVLSMSRMFSGASAFNQNVRDWNVSSLLYATYMFNSASAFSQDLSGWATDNVTECMGFANNSGLTAPQLPTVGPCFNP